MATPYKAKSLRWKKNERKKFNRKVAVNRAATRDQKGHPCKGAFVCDHRCDTKECRQTESVRMQYIQMNSRHSL